MNVSQSGLSSLPDDVAVNCLAQLSRFDLAALAMVSKSHRALVSSPELLELRRRMGCIEPCLYVCLQISGNPRWFVLNPHHHRLNPVPSNPNQAPELSSFVVVDGGIYVLGGLIHQSAVIEKKVYAVNQEGRGFYLSPSKGWFGTWGGIRDPFSGTRDDWCAIGKLLFCRAPSGRILWCDPEELHWKQVGFQEYCELRWKQVEGLEEYCAIQICRLCTNSAGNIVIFWKVSSNLGKRMLWSAEISLQSEEGEIPEEGEIWGKVEWSDAVFKLDDTLSSGFEVLYSASVLVSAK